MSVPEAVEATLQCRIRELETELIDLRSWKREWTETVARIMSEKCPHDEMHCTCVPFLRARIKELENEKKNRMRGRLHG